jgi:hypothetical protein
MKRGTENLINILNKVKKGKKFPADGEIAIICPV